MIYLPHPQFDFENCGGGGICGFVVEGFSKPKKVLLPEVGWRQKQSGKVLCPVSVTGSNHVYMESELWNVNVQKVISKFDKARSGYWEGRYIHPDTTYGFLREDGSEFAIRFIKANQFRWDVIGYKINGDMSEFKIWLESECRN